MIPHGVPHTKSAARRKASPLTLITPTSGHIGKSLNRLA